MKKKIACMIVVLIAISLFGCGKKEMDTSMTNDESVSVSSEESDSPTDNENSIAENEDVVYPTTIQDVYQLPDDYVIHWRDEALENWVRRRVVKDKDENYQITLGDVRDIETLYIGALTGETVECFDDLIFFESVETLSLMMLYQPSASLDVLKELTKLDKLTIFDCTMESGYEILKDLNITNLELKGIQNFNYQNIAECTGLTRLTINRCNMNQEDTQHLLNLEDLTHLSLFDVDIENFDFVSNYENLTKLEISGSNVVPDLASFENIDCRYLVLSDCGITDITNLKINESVEELDLSGNDITDVSVLSNYMNLENVKLNDNPNLESVEVLSSLAELRFLDIRNTSVVDVSFRDNLSSLYE